MCELSEVHFTMATEHRQEDGENICEHTANVTLTETGKFSKTLFSRSFFRKWY